MSSELKSTSRARFLPMSWGSRAMGPPPATIPTPTSHCERIAFSRLAKLMSQASVISLPLPVARPRMRAIEATGKRVRRARKSGQSGKPGGPAPVPVRRAGEGGVGGAGKAGQPREKVRPEWQACGPRRHSGQVLKLGREVRVIQEIVVDRAFKHHNSHLLVGLK